MSSLLVNPIAFRDANHLVEQLALLQQKLMHAGFDPTWSLYEKSIGWECTRGKYSASECSKIRWEWAQVYKQIISPVKSKMGEMKWKAFLSTMKQRTSSV